MRLIVRDNAGGVACQTVITVTQDAAPSELWCLTVARLSWLKVISWDICDTNVAPVSTAEVDFLLSIDGGETFSVDLGATDNDGYTTAAPGRYCSLTAKADDQRKGQYLLRYLGQIYDRR